MSVLEKLFGNAFSSPSSKELTPAELKEEDELFQRLAKSVVSRGLTVPAIMFLEMHQPFSFIAGQLAHSLGPFASIIVAEKDAEAFARSLSRRDGIERMVRAIEKEDRERAVQKAEPGEREV